MISTLWLSIGAIILLIAGVCIKVVVWNSDRLLQRRIDSLGRCCEVCDEENRD